MAYLVATACQTALGDSLQETWSNLCAGRSGLRPLGRLAGYGHADRIAGGFLHPGVALLDRCAMVASPLVGREPTPGTGLIVSTTKADMAAAEATMAGGHAPRDEDILPAAFAGLLAARLGLAGPRLVVSCACASGLVALATASRWIERGISPSVLVIGIDVLSDFVLSGFASLEALDSRPCKPYDAARAGTTLGEAIGAVLLCGKPRPGAIGLVGAGVSSDANHMTGPSRDGAGLARAIRMALRQSRLAPPDISWVNGHGTGTAYNDQMECHALHLVFGERVPPVVSFKGAIGHTLGAAGVVEATLCAESLTRGLVPPCIGHERCGVEPPIPVPGAVLPLKGRHVLSLKSGFGGVNAAVVFSHDPGGVS